MPIYLLPCSCGKKAPIEPRQAGEVIPCPCGASLTVPTMLEMATLERVERESDTRAERHPWGVTQQLILLGSLITLLTGAGAIYLFFTQPTLQKRDVSPSELRRQVQTLTPGNCWHLYRILRMEGPERAPTPKDVAHAKLLLQHRIYVGILTLFACVGIGLIVVAAVLMKRKRRVPGIGAGAGD